MTARPLAVGDRVRTVRSHLEDERVGVVVHIGDQSPRGYGEPYSVGVRLDDDGRYLGGSTLGYRLSELERLDDTREVMDFNPDELDGLIEAARASGVTEEPGRVLANFVRMVAAEQTA